MSINRTTLGALACALLVGGVAVADELGDSTFDLPREVVSAATAFETYMTTAAQVNSFSSGDSVEQGLRSGVSYQPAQLEEGMIAYGALAALRDDAFVEGVQRAAADEASRQALSDRLVDSPNDALQLDGSAEALQHISEALDARAEPLVAAGAEVKSAAYSVQHQAWSKVMVDDAQGRLAEVKQLSAARFEPKDSDYQDMLKTLATTDAGAGSGEARSTRTSSASDSTPWPTPAPASPTPRTVIRRRPPAWPRPRPLSAPATCRWRPTGP
jgi:hypothetical protein